MMPAELPYDGNNQIDKQITNLCYCESKYNTKKMYFTQYFKALNTVRRTRLPLNLSSVLINTDIICVPIELDIYSTQGTRVTFHPILYIPHKIGIYNL